MADVRSMLRAERESRRITHPHASYTSSGTLLCNLCDTTVKSDKAWSAHLHSTEHNLRSGRPKDIPPIPAATSKKRKAVEFDEVPITERKKAKGSASDKYPTPDHDERDQQGDVPPSTTEKSVPGTEDIPVPTEETLPRAADSSTTTNVADDDVNTADLEALERDLAEMEQQAIAQDKHSVLTAMSAAPTISAPAISSDEQGTKDGDDPVTRRSQREVENEEDREDAARALEEEFAEMDSLHDRAKRLRELREALRKGIVKPQDASSAANEPEDEPDGNVNVEDDDTDGSEYDDWTFGTT